MMKLLAVTVTYHPDINGLRSNILKYADGVDHLIIWDNSDNPHLLDELNFDKNGCEKIHAMGTGENVGIAYALNRAVEWGLEHSFTHLLTMDQDSNWVDFQSYKDGVREIDDSKDGNEDIAVYAPSIRLSDRFVRQAELACFTSGAVFPLDIFRKVGMFREDYVIDNVDTEFCYRCRAAGFRIKVLPDVLQHSLGRETVVFGRYRTFNYSPYRLYYIARNEIMLWKDYRKVPIEKKMHGFGDVNFRIFLFAKNIIYGENHKFAKLSAIVRGYLAGIVYVPKKESVHF